MIRFPLAALAAAGSAALLIGAFLFQAAGYAPCPMCLWQRWPHAIAVALGLAVLALGRRGLCWLGALLMAVSTGLGAFHAGVEQGWWEGPTTCTSGPIGGLSPDQLMDQILNAPLVRCDEIAWQLMGISMAGWNAIFSALLLLIWIAAARRG